MKGLFKANLYIAVMIINNGHKVIQVCFTAFHCVMNKMYNVSVNVRKMFIFSATAAERSSGNVSRRATVLSSVVSVVSVCLSVCPNFVNLELLLHLLSKAFHLFRDYWSTQGPKNCWTEFLILGPVCDLGP